ncbi:MAG: hypothetical protein KTR31_21320 [Myxococcales bacterium]|nr:hypothetical protein [Myxococcales bacterium]
MWISLLALPAAADDLQLILHDPTGTTAPGDVCDAALCTSLVTLIEGATETVDLAFYGFRHQSRLLQAAKAAQKRGVRVRVVVDMDVDGHNYYTSTPDWLETFEVRTDHETDLATKARKRSYSGRDRCRRPTGFQGPLQCLSLDMGDRCYVTAHASREPLTFQGDIMHDKFAVVDSRHVWTGSANASDSGTGGYNANLVILVDSPRVASWYTDEFEQMYVHGRYHASKERGSDRRHWIETNEVHVTSWFSPQDKPIDKHVRALLQGAEHRIDVAVFFLTHKGIAQDLLDAKRRGVKVRVIMDATAAKNGYSKHEVLRAAGIPVKIEDWGGKMHAKSMVIDSEMIVGGSMNFTAAGERGNDENTLLIRSRRHAAQYEAWFESLWNSIGDQWLRGRPDPESRASGTSCTDGVDNDFDDLADEDDPGCSDSPPALPSLPPGRVVPKPSGGRCTWDMD